jgi:nucleoside-diphosphate kinase
MTIGAEQPEIVLENNHVQEVIVQNQAVLENEISAESQTVDLKAEDLIVNKEETTFAIIKPDAVDAGYSGLIIDLIEKNGFEIVRMEKKTLTRENAMSFYGAHKEKPFYNDLVSYMISGPIIILELAKENAVADWRTLIGATDPEKAAVGTIRKMYGVSKTLNAVHGSDSQSTALQEIMGMFHN